MTSDPDNRTVAQIPRVQGIELVELAVLNLAGQTASVGMSCPRQTPRENCMAEYHSHRFRCSYLPTHLSHVLSKFTRTKVQYHLVGLANTQKGYVFGRPSRN
jgi:hypothetical protein